MTLTLALAQVETANEAARLLINATRHAAHARVHVSRQRQRVARLKATGDAARDAQSTLDALVHSLAMFEHYERQLRGLCTRRSAVRSVH